MTDTKVPPLEWRGLLMKIAGQVGAEKKRASNDFKKARLRMTEKFIMSGFTGEDATLAADFKARLRKELGREPSKEELARGFFQADAEIGEEQERAKAAAAPPPPPDGTRLLRAALKSAVRGEALADLEARAKDRVFATDTEAQQFIEGLRGEAPHFFVPSVGAAASGSRRAPNTGFDRTRYLDPAEFGNNLAAIAAGKAIR